MHEAIHSLSPFRWKGQDYNVLQCEYAAQGDSLPKHLP